MHRAYSVLTVKSASDGTRTFTGIATTPSTDRMGDSVDPEGAQMRLPLPLLLHHDSQKPVGVVESAKVAAAGITVVCRIAQPDEPGVLRERCDEAWHSVKAGVIRGLSIGFRALEDGVEKLRSGGLRFTALEILELSLVSIPANADATITAVKRYAGQRSPSGSVQLLTADRRAMTGRKGVPLIGRRSA
jgi:HK97 family phage prohead protease